MVASGVTARVLEQFRDETLVGSLALLGSSPRSALCGFGLVGPLATCHPNHVSAFCGHGFGRKLESYPKQDRGGVRPDRKKSSFSHFAACQQKPVARRGARGRRARFEFVR